MVALMAVMAAMLKRQNKQQTRPRESFEANNVGEAVTRMIPYLEDTTQANQDIYFDGWSGLAASKVLRAIAQDPPPSLTSKFDSIIHVDCSRWKNRRAVQKEIAHKLELQQQVMDIFSKQDEDDDLNGVDEGHRVEIRDVGRAIHHALQGRSCLVVFHNGSNQLVDFNDFGIPKYTDAWSNHVSKVLWTFRGRLNVVKGDGQTKPKVKSIPKEPDEEQLTEGVNNSQIYLYSYFGPTKSYWMDMLQEEAKEIVQYTDSLDATAEEATKCCLYLLSLACQYCENMDYNWATHASNYWVCDGIIQGGQSDKAWKVAASLHQQMRLEDYSPDRKPHFDDKLEAPPNRWVSEVAKGPTYSYDRNVHPESTSFFLTSWRDRLDEPSNMFQQSKNLCVLKLYQCTFSFYSPPFSCCRSLRFLGLDHCKDQGHEQKQKRPAMEFFHSLWVLDICYTDWGPGISEEITEQMVSNIREVHIKKGRIWRHNLAWRELKNLHKLLVIEPTSPWETGKKDEFTDMLKLELLDLSKNSTMQILPSLSGATGLKILVLDGCVGLDHVDHEELPPLLESFSLDARDKEGDVNKEAAIARISLVGCARLVNFRLGGSLPKLAELDISATAVEILNLQNPVVQVPSLQQIILLRCLQLKTILLPGEGLPKLGVFQIDSNSPGQIIWPCMWDESLLPGTCCTYTDVAIDKVAAGHEHNSSVQFQPSGCHLEIGEGIAYNNMASAQGVSSVISMLNKAGSMHMHDNSSITTAIPERLVSAGRKKIGWFHLKQCHVARCPMLHTIFPSHYEFNCFQELESFSASDLLMARCIWSKGMISTQEDLAAGSFVNLRSIQLQSCPRLTFVLPLWSFTLPNLETLKIAYCYDLKYVFPVDLAGIAASHGKRVLFQNLKSIHLQELPKLQKICEAQMIAPNLETVKLRGCWSLRCLPATAIPHGDSRPVVDCEKDLWEKLEWDGLEAGHHHSLFVPRHSLYYKQVLPRVSVLR